MMDSIRSDATEICRWESTCQGEANAGQGVLNLIEWPDETTHITISMTMTNTILDLIAYARVPIFIHFSLSFFFFLSSRTVDFN